MKKLVKKLMALTLVVAFMLSSVNVMAAENVNVELEGSTGGKVVSKKATLKGASDYLSGTYMKNEDSSKSAYTGIRTLNGTSYFPVVPSATGKLYLDARKATGSVTVSVGYADEDGYFVKTGNSGYLYSGYDKTVFGGADVSYNKKYYICFKTSSVVELELRAYVYSYTDNRTLTAGKYTYSSAVKGTSNTTTALYYKIQPSKTGTIAVSLKEYGDSYSTGYVTLYNSSKTRLSDQKIWYNSSNSNYRVYFGVKAGRTYYIKVENCYGVYSNGYCYGVKYTNTSATDRNIGTKSKAKKLYRKGDYTSSLFVASTSTSTDWYKFYVSSKRKTVIKLDTTGIKSGDIEVSVYRGSKKIGSTQTIGDYSNGAEYTITYGTTYGKASSGTYYVKVRKLRYTSGKYKIKYAQ